MSKILLSIFEFNKESLCTAGERGGNRDANALCYKQWYIFLGTYHHTCKQTKSNQSKNNSSKKKKKKELAMSSMRVGNLYGH